jgi:hypothetical protein
VSAVEVVQKLDQRLNRLAAVKTLQRVDAPHAAATAVRLTPNVEQDIVVSDPQWTVDVLQRASKARISISPDQRLFSLVVRLFRLRPKDAKGKTPSLLTLELISHY